MRSVRLVTILRGGRSLVDGYRHAIAFSTRLWFRAFPDGFELSALSDVGASFASSAFVGAASGSAVCEGEADVSSEAGVGWLVVTLSFSGTSGGAETSVGGGSEAGSLSSPDSSTAFAGVVVSCVGAASRPFEIEEDLSPGIRSCPVNGLGRFNSLMCRLFASWAAGSFFASLPTTCPAGGAAAIADTV